MLCLFSCVISKSIFKKKKNPTFLDVWVFLLVVTQIFVRIFALLTRGGFLVCVCVYVWCV